MSGGRNTGTGHAILQLGTVLKIERSANKIQLRRIYVGIHYKYRAFSEGILERTLHKTTYPQLIYPKVHSCGMFFQWAHPETTFK